MNKDNLKKAHKIYTDLVMTQTYKPLIIREAHEFVFGKTELMPFPQIQRELIGYFQHVFKEEMLIEDKVVEEEVKVVKEEIKNTKLLIKKHVPKKRRRVPKKTTKKIL